jgi:hypothetical protein
MKRTLEIIINIFAYFFPKKFKGNGKSKKEEMKLNEIPESSFVLGNNENDYYGI